MLHNAIQIQLNLRQRRRRRKYHFPCAPTHNGQHPALYILEGARQPGAQGGMQYR